MSEIPQITQLRYYVSGLGTAPLFMAFFGFAWWAWGSGNGLLTALPGGSVTFYTILAVFTVLLVGGGVYLLRSARRLPLTSSPQTTANERDEGRRYGRWFGIIFGLEIVIISIGINILNAIHHVEFAPSFTAIVVGLHFLPLAWLFRVRPYYVTGALLTLIGLVAILVGREQDWNPFVCGACALVLWLTGITAITLGADALRRAQRLIQAPA